MTPGYYVLTGPTAAGKTAALVDLARHRPVLAVSADSRQVFKYMDIGTGKPSPQELEALPHLGIDLCDPDSDFSAHRFQAVAAKAFMQAKQSNRVPWLVGGTGLYIKSVVDRYLFGVAPRKRLRQAIAKLLKNKRPEILASEFAVELREIHNPARLIRAVENACSDQEIAIQIYKKAGLKAIDQQNDEIDQRQESTSGAFTELDKWHCLKIVVLDPGKPILSRYIESRVTGMFGGGLVEEVENIRRLGFGDANVVRNGIGYREAGAMLDGAMGVKEALERTIIRTRQYAKRQRTFFKGCGWDVMNPEQLKIAMQDLPEQLQD